MSREDDPTSTERWPVPSTQCPSLVDQYDSSWGETSIEMTVACRGASVTGSKPASVFGAVWTPAGTFGGLPTYTWGTSVPVLPPVLVIRTRAVKPPSPVRCTRRLE